MIATLPYIQQKFNQFNTLMFEGALPPVRLRLSRARTTLGACAFKKKRTAQGRIKKYDFEIRISTARDMSEQLLEDTIIHEMIHYYIGVNDITDTAPHGQVFQRMMNDINTRFGRHITISHHSTDEEREEAVDKRPKWHVIAVVTFRDGRKGIKVLPRIVQRIVTYHNQVLMVPEIASVSLFMTNNPFFNRYPNSSALRVYFLDADTISANLQAAERMEVRGTQLVRNV